MRLRILCSCAIALAAAAASFAQLPSPPTGAARELPSTVLNAIQKASPKAGLLCLRWLYSSFRSTVPMRPLFRSRTPTRTRLAPSTGLYAI